MYIGEAVSEWKKPGWDYVHMVHVKTAGVQPVTSLECFPGISFFDTLQVLLATGHL